MPLFIRRDLLIGVATLFYETLPGRRQTVRFDQAVGAALSFWDLSRDAPGLMRHRGLGTEDAVAREARHWQVGMNGNGAFLDWSTAF